MLDCRGTIDYDEGKIRLAARGRLSEDVLERLHRAGFRWNRREQVFVASWRPAREDVALVLCGSLQEDTGESLERAAARAAEYRSHGDEANRKSHVAALRFARLRDSMGDDPLKVGHHSAGGHQSDRDKMQALGLEANEMKERAEYWWGRAHRLVETAARRYTFEALTERLDALEASFLRMDTEVGRLIRKTNRTPEEEARLKEMRRWARFTEDCARATRARLDGLIMESTPSYSRVNVEVGDQVLANGHWHAVLRTNPKTVRVGCWLGNPTLAVNLPYDRIEELRKMEVQHE